MTSLPSPSVMKLDPNDENIILGIPEDYDPEKKRNDASSTPKKVFHICLIYKIIYIFMEN